MNVKKLAILLAPTVAICIAVPSVASAAPSGWMLNGKTFREDGITSAAVKTVAKEMENAKLVATGVISIECEGNVEYASPTLSESKTSSANTLIMTECKNTEAGCTVPPTIGTVPLTLEGTLDGALATKGVIRPSAGTTFTTIRVSGQSCALSGNKPVTGDLEMLSPEGQDERTDQLETANQGATGLFKVLSAAATLSGSALVLLANNQAWSFL